VIFTHLKKLFNISAFDAVIGNPPYNKSKGNVYKGGHGGKSLWDKFVLITLENLLVEYGYLLFVAPICRGSGLVSISQM
jgi:tRNA1(Val) A37 N6-methylase TrmN6